MEEVIVGWIGQCGHQGSLTARLKIQHHAALHEPS